MLVTSASWIDTERYTRGMQRFYGDTAQYLAHLHVFASLFPPWSVPTTRLPLYQLFIRNDFSSGHFTETQMISRLNKMSFVHFTLFQALTFLIPFLIRNFIRYLFIRYIYIRNDLFYEFFFQFLSYLNIKILFSL